MINIYNQPLLLFSQKRNLCPHLINKSIASKREIENYNLVNDWYIDDLEWDNIYFNNFLNKIKF